MKQNKWSSEEVLVEIITSMAAAELEEQEKSIRERLGELSSRLQELMDNHPDEYWEAAGTMDPTPTLLHRRPLPQLEWRKEHEDRGILLKGKRGNLFDPNLPLNKDVIEAWEVVKQLQHQHKDRPPPTSEDLKKEVEPKGEDVAALQWAEELRNLPPLGEKTVPQWKPWIRVAFLANHNQHPEKTAHAAENIRNRDAIKNISDPDKRDAAVFDRLWNEMVVVKKGALTMLAKDLDRVRGL